MSIERVAGHYGVMEVRELGGWVVVDADAYRLAEPGELWPTEEQARQAAERHRRTDEEDDAEQRRMASEIARRGIRGG